MQAEQQPHSAHPCELVLLALEIEEGHPRGGCLVPS